jgi:membrane protease YdiL (CAAX protease family)
MRGGAAEKGASITYFVSAPSRWIPSTWMLFVWAIVLYLAVEHSVPLPALVESTWSGELVRSSLVCALIAGLLPIYLKRDGLDVAALGFTRRSWRRDVVSGAVLGAALWAGNCVFFYLMKKIVTGSPEVNVGMSLFASSPAQAGAKILCIVVVGPLMEEILFRACIVVPLRARWGTGPRRDVVYALVSGIFFATAHLVGHPLYYAGYVLLGVAFARVYQRTGSLRTVFIAHGCMNALALFFARR